MLDVPMCENFLARLKSFVLRPHDIPFMSHIFGCVKNRGASLWNKPVHLLR